MACLKVIVFCAITICCVNSRLILPNSFRFPKYHLARQIQFTDPISEKTAVFQEKENTLALKPVEEKTFIISDEKLSWFEASVACLDKGLRLASIEDVDQVAKLEQYIRGKDLVPADVYSGYWIGGHRESDSEAFTWESNGKHVQAFGWLPGEPNYYTGENCIELKNLNNDLGWNNYYCTEPKRYICEAEDSNHESMKNEKLSYTDYIHEEEKKNIVPIEHLFQAKIDDDQDLSTVSPLVQATSSEPEVLPDAIELVHELEVSSAKAQVVPEVYDLTTETIKVMPDLILSSSKAEVIPEFYDSTFKQSPVDDTFGEVYNDAYDYYPVEDYVDSDFVVE